MRSIKTYIKMKEEPTQLSKYKKSTFEKMKKIKVIYNL